MLYQDSLNWSKISSIVKDNETIKQIQEAAIRNDINKQDLETVYLRMNGLETMVKEQSLMLGQLHEDLKRLVTQTQGNVSFSITIFFVSNNYLPNSVNSDIVCVHCRITLFAKVFRCHICPISARLNIFYFVCTS